MDILVTGATGTVGRKVVEHLVQAGHTVRVRTRNPEAAALPDAVQVVPCGACPPYAAAAAAGVRAGARIPPLQQAARRNGGDRLRGQERFTRPGHGRGLAGR
ncbi:hypothetical protein GCM10010211_43210 [Streptomyces albospinus]|uniref:NmrA-like domain-containing protein n=1 Tax=Streptomyces albospinus TaxID=285515 RepID=A0ABQ2V875_9ACTN|nr:hypothetical protein GCM10010211_43210 [Streptomyces albospinus]